SPFFSLAEQRAEWDCQRIIRFPNRHVDDDAVIMPKSRPCFRRIDKVDCDTDPLFLNSQRRDLEKSRRVNPRHAALNRWSAPAVDPHGCAVADLDGVGRQQIRDYFEVERVADLDQWSASLNNGLALLNDLEHTPGHRCPDLDTANRIDRCCRGGR